MWKQHCIAVCLAATTACVASPENGDVLSNPSSVAAGGWVFIPGDTIGADVWHATNEVWQPLQTTTADVSPTVVVDSEELFAWQMTLDLGGSGSWTGPGTTGEARIRFNLPGTPYSLLSFDQGGYGCAAAKVILDGEYPSVAGVDCGSTTAPAINLLRNQALRTVYLVRHAEKQAGSGDVPLTPEGQTRAVDLSDELTYAPLTGIITSTALRTQQTAAPTAARTGVTPIAATSYPQIAQLVDQSSAGESVLVVGHSNTLATIAAALGVPGGDLPPAVVSGFDNLYVVHIPIDGTTPTIAHRTYGAPSP